MSYSASATATISESLGSGSRALYGVIGAICLIIAISLLYSGLNYGLGAGSGWFATTFLQWLVIIALFVIGIANLVSASSKAEGASSAHRGIRVAIGVIVIILAILAILPLAFGVSVGGYSGLVLLSVFVGVALIFEAIFLIVVGMVPEIPTWIRGVSIVLGIIVLIFGVFALVYPFFGPFLVWLVFSIALLAVAIRLLLVAASGIRVSKFTVTAA
ncbi:MAG: hypothetical protein WAN74_05145 [Thermoplasmata archaeon]